MARSGKRWNPNTHKSVKDKPKIRRAINPYMQGVKKGDSIEQFYSHIGLDWVERYYHTRVWAKLKSLIFDDSPLCYLCDKVRERVTIATTIHHAVPLIEEYPNNDKSFDSRYMFALCASCHGFVSVLEKHNLKAAKALFGISKKNKLKIKE